MCRSGAEESRPLYTPCLCSGSIGLVHQDCLEAWLNHSKKDTCELCFSKYQFVPLYSPDAPSSLPISVMIRSICSITIKHFLPFTIRFVLAAVIWLAFVPIAVTSIYCLCIGRQNAVFTLAQEEDKIGKVWSVIVCGLVLLAVMATSLLILVSDFKTSQFSSINDPKFLFRCHSLTFCGFTGCLVATMPIPTRWQWGHKQRTDSPTLVADE